MNQIGTILPGKATKIPTVRKIDVINILGL